MKLEYWLCSLMLLVFALFQAKSGGPKGPRGDLASLFEAERSFSRASEKNGIRAAFLEYLAEDAVVFRPRPVEAIKWYAERPAPPGLLTWEPVFGEVSDSGDLGYTTGPYVFKRSGADDPNPSYGHYVSIWRKRADEPWRVVIDLGISHGRPDSSPVRPGPSLSQKAGSGRGEHKVDVEGEAMALIGWDQEFSGVSASKGLVAAYTKFSDEAVRYYRVGTFPVVGKERMLAVLKTTPGQITWQPAAASVSVSGDLGYSYGMSELKKPGEKDGKLELSSYLRVWKRVDRSILRGGGRYEWKLSLDIATPVPPAQP